MTKRVAIETTLGRDGGERNARGIIRSVGLFLRHLFSTDHKVIGLLYGFTSLFFLLVGFVGLHQVTAPGSLEITSLQAVLFYLVTFGGFVAFFASMARSASGSSSFSALAFSRPSNQP